MKFSKRTLAKIESSDSQCMQDAISKLLRAGLKPYRTSHHQLKCGPYNFWPSTGAIVKDPWHRLAEVGINAFIRLATAEVGTTAEDEGMQLDKIILEG